MLSSGFATRPCLAGFSRRLHIGRSQPDHIVTSSIDGSRLGSPNGAGGSGELRRPEAGPAREASYSTGREAMAEFEYSTPSSRGTTSPARGGCTDRNDRVRALLNGRHNAAAHSGRLDTAPDSPTASEIAPLQADLHDMHISLDIDRGITNTMDVCLTNNRCSRTLAGKPPALWVLHVTPTDTIAANAL